MSLQAPNTEVQIAFPESRSGAKSSFNVDRFFTRLKSQTVGSTLGTTKELPSTQDFLKNGISAWPDGTTIFTEKQTAGKGQLSGYQALALVLTKNKHFKLSFMWHIKKSKKSQVYDPFHSSVSKLRSCPVRFITRQL